MASVLSLGCARRFTCVVIMHQVMMVPILQVEKQRRGEVRPLASGPTGTEVGSEPWSPDHTIDALPFRRSLWARKPSSPLLHEIQTNTKTSPQHLEMTFIRTTLRRASCPVPAMSHPFFSFLPVSSERSRTQEDGHEAIIWST